MAIRMSLVWMATAAALMAQPQGRGPRPGGFDGPGGPGPRFIGAQPGMSGRLVKNAAYSADMITETSQTLADGNRIRKTSTSKIYRDSEGRTRREQSLDALNSLSANSNLTPVVFISDPVAGSDYVLNPSSKTATKSSRPSRPMQEGGGRPGLSPVAAQPVRSARSALATATRISRPNSWAAS